VGIRCRMLPGIMPGLSTLIARSLREPVQALVILVVRGGIRLILYVRKYAIVSL
jgi:hypothetical protein